MSTPGSRRRILLVDQQDCWRVRAARALEAAGFLVCQVGEDEPSSGASQGELWPDLVVLGCANIGAQERVLIEDFIARGWPLLVVSASLPWEVMHSAFVAGADDVTEKPYDPEQLVAIVNQALKSVANHDEYSSVLRRRAQ